MKLSQVPNVDVKGTPLVQALLRPLVSPEMFSVRTQALRGLCCTAIRETRSSQLTRDTDWPEKLLVAFSVPLGKQSTTATFHVLFKSLFTNGRSIRRYKI
jgi:hypothetical protein